MSREIVRRNEKRLEELTWNQLSELNNNLQYVVWVLEKEAKALELKAKIAETNLRLKALEYETRSMDQLLDPTAFVTPTDKG